MQRPDDPSGDKATRPQHKTTTNGTKTGKEDQITFSPRIQRLSPAQEEVIYVIEGEVEQWLDRQKRVLRSGDAVFIPAGVVHASFNVAGAKARMLAILGPCVGRENGYEVTEVADQEPW